MLKLPNTQRWRILALVIALSAWGVLPFVAACSEPAPTLEPRETKAPASASPRQGVKATATPMQPGTPPTGLRPAATATPISTEDAAPSSSQASELVNGATWVLVSLDGQPPIDGTFATLKVDGESFGGFDGCNTFGGRHDDGTPVAGTDGTFRTPGGVASTAIGCTTPEGILDQADRYMRAIREGDGFRVTGDRLEILDGRGDVRLIFTKQEALPGRAADLTGTQWRLVNDGDEVADGNEFTLAFLDDSLAAGTTVCRDFAMKYKAVNGRVNFTATSMIGSAAECPGDTWEPEGRFTTDLSRASEYSVDEEPGKKRLYIRTSRGRTLTFESIPRDLGGISGVEWHLTAIVVSPGEGLESLAKGTKDAVPETEVTVLFEENGFWGSTGCNSYASTTVTEPRGAGEPIIGEDGSVAKDRRTTVTQRGCPDTPGVMEQEQRIVELLPVLEQVQVFGDRLAIHTEPDVFLLFQAR